MSLLDIGKEIIAGLFLLWLGGIGLCVMIGFTKIALSMAFGGDGR